MGTSGAFRRMTDPVMVTVGAAASNVAVPADLIKPGWDAFCVINSNQCWVRLRGSQVQTAVTTSTGWLLPPGFVGVFGTQSPKFMSAMAVDRPGFAIAGLSFVPLEVSYGNGA